MDHQTHSKKIENNYGRETGSVLSFVFVFLYFSISSIFEWSHLVKFDFTLFLTVVQVS